MYFIQRGGYVSVRKQDQVDGRADRADGGCDVRDRVLSDIQIQQSERTVFFIGQNDGFAFSLCNQQAVPRLLNNLSHNTRKTGVVCYKEQVFGHFYVVYHVHKVEASEVNISTLTKMRFFFIKFVYST